MGGGGGGGNKPAQRTKNNARPASSARSAELLGGARSSFLGFAAGAASFPVAPEGDVTPEFQLVFKKLNKKDPITKSKALKEMSDLVKESSIEDVTNTLPHWTRLYRTLTTDIEHRVREATQATHGIIVSKCGRSIAPHLKHLIPTWLTAQYDNFAPAASHAQASLQGAFPEGKLPEVISFCKSEVLAHISINLIGNGQAILLVDKDTPPEVTEMMHQRVTTATLQGYDYFTKHLPDKNLEWLWVDQAEVLDSNKFWKLASNKCAQIRSAWFGVIARQIQRFPEQFADTYGAKFTKILIGSLIEKDPVVATQLWDCFLLLTVNLKDWYTWVDKKEELSKRILQILENGGWGNAVHLSSTILPLLANLPADMLTKEFYTAFFVAMLNSIDKKAILASKSQHQACMDAIGECLRYLSLHEINTFAIEIVTSALRNWLEKILQSPYPIQSRNNIIKYSATVMASLIKYWLKQSRSNDKYDQIIRNFWQNKCSTIIHQIDKLSTDKDEITRCIDGHILLLRTLKVSFLHEGKKQASIKFECDANVKAEKSKEESVDSILKERYMHNLNNLIFATSSHYLQFADKKEITVPVLAPLYTLLDDFDCEELYATIANDFASKGIFGLYNNVFRRWLSGDTMRCKEVVDIMFLLIPYLSSDEQRMVFKSFNQFVPPVVEVCISKCLSHPYSTYECVREWVKSALVDVSLAAICKRLVKDGDGHSRNLLLMSFSQDGNGDIMISDSACSGILSILESSLRDLESPYLDMCCSLASQLTTVLLCEDKSQHYKDLLLQMFTLNATFKPNEDNLSEDTWCEVKSSWQDGLSSMEEDDRVEFIQKAVTIIRDTLISSKEDLDIKKIDDIIELSTNLMLKFNIQSNPEDSLLDMVTIAKTLFHTESTEQYSTVEISALKYDCLVGNLNCPFFGHEITKQIVNSNENVLTSDVLRAHINNCLIRAKYLCTVVNGPQVTEEEEIGENLLEWSTVILTDKYIKECFFDLLRDYCILESLHRGFTFSPLHQIISEHIQTLDEIIRGLSTVCVCKKIRAQYHNSVQEKAAKEGYYWSFAREYYENVTSSKNIDIVRRECSSIAINMADGDVDKILTGNGFFHNMQTAAHSLKEPYFTYSTNCKVMIRSFYLAYSDRPEVTDEHFINACASEDVMDVIVETYYKNNDVMLYDRDLLNDDWAQVVCNAAILDTLTSKIKLEGWDMSDTHWDFTTIALSSIVHSLEKSKSCWNSPKVVLLARAVFDLFVTADEFISTIRATCLTKQPSEHVANLPTEWQDIFLPDLVEHVLRIVLRALATPPDAHLDVNHIVFLSHITSAVRLLTYANLPQHLRLGELSPGNIVAACLGLLDKPGHHVMKYCCYEVLKIMTPALLQEDVDKLNAWCEAAELTEQVPERPQFCLQRLHDIICSLQDIVEIALAPIRLAEDSSDVVPFTDSHSMALSYLLLYEFILTLCSTNHSELQQQYIEFFSKGKYVSYLMRNCIRMLPPAVIQRAQDTSTNVSAQVNDFFTTTPTLDINKAPLSSDVAALSCRCLFLALQGAGAAAARGWYGTLSGRTSKVVDRIVSLHVTPVLMKNYFNGLQAKASSNPDLTISIHSSVNEVVAEYLLDGRKMELLVQFSTNHPLGIPRVESNGTPISHVQWLSMYLSYQNGDLWQCIRMWTEAVARKVQSSAVCYVCYSRMHPTSGQLPRVKCTRCKNRFHYQCLFKWFKAAPVATCPICRSQNIKM